MSRNHPNHHLSLLKYLLAIFLVFVLVAVVWCAFSKISSTKPAHTSKTSQSSSAIIPKTKESSSASASVSAGVAYAPSQEEVAYLKQRFADLSAVNPEVVGYIYAPGTMLDEPVVQTSDNSHYLDYTFDGSYQPFMGTVFMDKDNRKDFSDSLTWLFGHARGSQVGDHRMFNDVNFYDKQSYFDQHPYVVLETPSRKYYYEAMFFIVVPETTAFYRTSFDSKEQFAEQLNEVAKDAISKKADAKADANDHYLVLSTCREEDTTIRANLYLRRIPDDEMNAFVKEHASQLTYQATR